MTATIVLLATIWLHNHLFTHHYYGIFGMGHYTMRQCKKDLFNAYRQQYDGQMFLSCENITITKDTDGEDQLGTD